MGQNGRVLQSPERANSQRTCLAGRGVPTLGSALLPSWSPGLRAHWAAATQPQKMGQRTLRVAQAFFHQCGTEALADYIDIHLWLEKLMGRGMTFLRFP